MSRLRDAARVVRRLPVARRVVEASDPKRRAALIARSGLLDTELYAAQLGVDEIGVDEAANHYVRYGWLAGLTINPLLDPFVVQRQLGDTGRPPLYDYLNMRAWDRQVSAVWNAPAYLAEAPDAASHPAGPAGHLWERIQADPATALTVLPGGARSLPWSDIGPVMRRATAEWAEQLEAERARHARRILRHPRHLEDDALPGSGPTVSIVMPVWNRGASMRRAVESVLAQEWPWWELIIVDDGSWDDSPVIGELLASRDPRIRHLRRPHEGVCAARNAGLAQARGTYVAFLDSDNTWTPRFLRDVVTTMEREALETAYATIELLQHPNPETDPDADPDEIVRRYRHGSPALESLLQGNSIDLNVLVTRVEAARAVGGFDATLRRAVDYDFILKLAERSEPVHVPTVGVEYDDRESSEDRISTSEPVGWNTLVRLRHLPEPVEATHPGGSVISILQANDAHLPEKLRELMTLTSDSSVILAAVGVEPDEWRAIRVAAHARDGVRSRLYHWSEPYAYVVNSAARTADGAAMVVIDPRSRFTADAVRRLTAAVRDEPGAAHMPLTTAPDGGVAHAGSVFVTPRRLPGRLFAGHPVEDPRALGDSYDVPALTGRTFAVSTPAFRAAGGLHPLLHNQHEAEGLSLALSALPEPVSFRVHTDIVLAQTSTRTAFVRGDAKGNRSVIRELTASRSTDDPNRYYGAADQRAGSWTTDEHGRLFPVVTRMRRTTTLPDGRVVPRLRWAILTAAPAGPAGAGWGDTHFAESLAAALVELGQEPVVLPREAHGKPARRLDDVQLVLRGLDRVQPDPGVLSLMWVISHPGMVSRSEAVEFDRVFAASLSWSRRMSEHWGLRIDPLLQCTDPERFRPRGAARAGEVLFVGKSRGIPRPVVMEAARSGVDFALYGGEWEGLVPPGTVRGEYVPNAELGAMYESAALVLNDHWADMRREGFISNRLFDVVASGGRALSDHVDGVDEVFGPAVRTFSRVSEIAPLLQSDHDSLFGSDEEIREVSERIRAEHSFRARAEVLLQAALEGHDWV